MFTEMQWNAKMQWNTKSGKSKVQNAEVDDAEIDDAEVDETKQVCHFKDSIDFHCDISQFDGLKLNASKYMKSV